MAEATRPYRHLCPEADERDAMDDAEFWQRVADNLTPPDTFGPDDDYAGELDVAVDAGVCDTCGAAGACGYDSEGRALIHATTTEDRDV